MFARNVGDSPCAAIAHRKFQFALHNFNYPIDPGLTERSQTPQEGTPNPNSFGAKREGFEHIRTAAKASIDKYWNLAANFGHDFGQRFDCGAKSFRGASTVI